MQRPLRFVHARGRLAIATFVVALLGASGAADAKTVSIRVESAGVNLDPRTVVSLGSAPVSRASGTAGEICSGDSVIGALHAATAGNWDGQWTDAAGWSIDRILSSTATAVQGRKWAVYVDNKYLNDPPCKKVLDDGDNVLIYPTCTTAISGCFSSGPLVLDINPIGSPKVALAGYAWQLVTTFSDTGLGETVRKALAGATLTSADAHVLTDDFGTASILVVSKGDNAVTLTKSTFVPDRQNVCITDGADGFCGTEPATPVPFDPYAFCTTNGHDGLCNTRDLDPPVGRITAPAQAAALLKSSNGLTLRGTVDFDPSLTDHVDLKLVRRYTTVRTVIKKRRVTVEKRVHGKVRRVRVIKRTRKRVKQAACVAWNEGANTWKALKVCSVKNAPKWRADGAQVWSYEFQSGLAGGSYTLDALAEDGAGNVDATPEPGRNQVTFTVK